MTGSAVLTVAADHSSTRDSGPDACTPITSRDPDRSAMRTMSGGEGEGKDGGPQESEPCGCTDLRVGGDAGRVVVGRTRDEPRAEPPEVAGPVHAVPVLMVTLVAGLRSGRGPILVLSACGRLSR